MKEARLESAASFLFSAAYGAATTDPHVPPTCHGNHAPAAPGSDPEQAGFRRWLRYTEHVGNGFRYVDRLDDTEVVEQAHQGNESHQNGGKGVEFIHGLFFL